MTASILQSEPWARFQRSLGKEVFERSGDGWAFLAIMEKTPLGRFLYVPYGPAAADHAALVRALAALRSLAPSSTPTTCGSNRWAPTSGNGRRRRCSHGPGKAPVDVQPKLTWMLDLNQPEEELLAGMRSTSRNLYRNIHKKGVTFDVSSDPEDIGILLGFLHDVSERADFKAQSDDYLRQAARNLVPAGAAKIFTARLDGKPIAAALSYDTESTRVYAHAAADDTHRKLNAGIPLVVTMMLDARAAGMDRLDMWGVGPEDQPDHQWAGFSRFKRSFGGYGSATRQLGPAGQQADVPGLSAHPAARERLAPRAQGAHRRAAGHAQGAQRRRAVPSEAASQARRADPADPARHAGRVSAQNPAPAWAGAGFSLRLDHPHCAEAVR